MIGFLKKIWEKFYWFIVLYPISLAIIVVISVLINPYFDISMDAFSDLGLSIHWGYIFNKGLMYISSPLALLMSIYMIIKADSKTRTVGSTFLLFSGIMLFFIGKFPADTFYHDFIAYAYFYSFFFGAVLWGIDRFPDFVLSISISILFIIGQKIDFPSIAYAELYMFALMILFFFYSFLYYRKEYYHNEIQRIKNKVKRGDEALITPSPQMNFE